MKKVALYGGSFDPPHIGHEAVVKALKKLEFLDKIILMPTFLNPFKESVSAPSSLRFSWLKLLFANDKRVIVSSFETDMQRKVSSIESVKYLLQQYEEVYLVIGADNLKSLKQWHKYDELQELVTFIVATRDEIKIPKKFFRLEVNENISSSSLRKNLKMDKIPQIIAKDVKNFFTQNNK